MERSKHCTVRELELLLQLRDRVASFVRSGQNSFLFGTHPPLPNHDTFFTEHPRQRGVCDAKLARQRPCTLACVRSTHDLAQLLGSKSL